VPVVFSEDFEKGSDRWGIRDSKTWKLSQRDGNSTLEITERKSKYKPEVRSLGHIVLIKDAEVKDFELSFNPRQGSHSG